MKYTRPLGGDALEAVLDDRVKQPVPVGIGRVVGASCKVGSGFVIPTGTLSGHWPLVVGRGVFLRW